MDTPILSLQLRVERKQFFVDLKENGSGRFLRITEEVFGRRNTIILPSSGLGDFLEILHEMAHELEELGEVIAPTPVEGSDAGTSPEQPPFFSNPPPSRH